VTKEPYLSSILRNIYEHKLDNLLKRTRIEMSPDHGRIMMGTADDTGSLCYGEVYVQYSVNIDRRQEETKVLEGTVVVAKNPCFHPGDLRKFTAVNKPQLKHMIDCIVFPIQGSRPHPDEMSGSDLDGDMYFVCWNQQLQPSGVNRAPMKPKPKQVLDRPVTESDMIDFIGKYIEGDRLGVIANSYLAHADGQERGIFSQHCLDLAQMHSDAVDFPKTGFSVRITPELRPRQYPHYMLKRDKPGYRSDHVLGKLFDQCQSIASNRGEHAEDLDLDKNILVPGYKAYLDVAASIHDYYRINIQRLMNEYGISTEAEIVTGHILKLKKQRRGTLQRENVEIAEIINSQLTAIKSKVKEMFSQAVGKQSGDSFNLERSRLASALYFVTYSELTVDRAYLSLPWIFVDHLLFTGRFHDNPNTVSLTPHIPNQRQPRSVLQQMSMEVAGFQDCNPGLDESRKRRNEAFQRLSDVIKQSESVQVVLSVFGSHATRFDDTTSSLDVFCDAMSQECLDRIMSVVKNEYNFPYQRSFKMDLKPIVVKDDVNCVQICLYTSRTCTRRTVYIISAVAGNAWIVPVLNTMLSWTKRSKITGNDRGNTMTTEQFILLFLSYSSQNVATYQPVDVEDHERVTELLVQNHFSDCKASNCTHIKMLSTILQTLQMSDKSTSSYYCDDADKCANVILDFLGRCSSLQGAIIKDVVDPACEDGGTKLLNFKEAQYQRLAERMLKAYHTLAQSGHFVDLVKESIITDGHLSMDLPQQVCKRILLAEKSYAEKLRRESKAEEVLIRRRPYRDSLAGLVLEAWGSLQSLQLISDLISDEAKAKPQLFAPGGTHYALENAYVTVFRNSSSNSSSIMFVDYFGPCQINHNQLKRNIPRVRNPLESSFSYDKFIKCSMQQLDSINANYDENVHGRIRAVISYGTLYVANCSTRQVTESEFDDLFASGHAAQAANPDLLRFRPCGRSRGRGRRPQGRGFGRSSDSRSDTYNRASFIPTGNPHIDSSRLQNFLQRYGFVLAEETVDYRLSLKLNISGQQLKLEAVVALDENFNLKYINLPDFKWLCVSVVSANKDSSYRPYDSRFKIQSRIKRNVLQLKRESVDFANIIAKHRKMLLRSGNDVYGVHRDFVAQVKFVRKKDTKVYLAANPHGATTDAFLYGTAIRINYGTEYSRPTPTGTFRNVERNRVEVTAVPELPDLRDDDKMKIFFTKCWQFAEELGSVLE